MIYVWFAAMNIVGASITHYCTMVSPATVNDGKIDFLKVFSDFI